MLRIENLSKQYKEKWAVKEFSAELTEGVYALIGPNGSGKTTLMRMLANILKPTSGRVLFNDEDISLLNEKYRDRLGYLPQEFGVYPNFSAERFLHYFATLKGLEKNEAKDKVDEVLHLVNLQDVRKKKTKTFSGGMKRRLGIAQALLNDPEILVVDEPTAGLDPKERIRFRNLLSDISDRRIVIFSTHIVSDIEYIAKEILLMEQGELKRHSDMDGLLKEMEGKVWEVIVEESELQRIQQQHKIGNILRQREGVQLRIISDEAPFPDATAIPPTLEDVYLYYFNEGGIEHVQA